MTLSGSCVTNVFWSSSSAIFATHFHEQSYMSSHCIKRCRLQREIRFACWDFGYNDPRGRTSKEPTRKKLHRYVEKVRKKHVRMVVLLCMAAHCLALVSIAWHWFWLALKGLTVTHDHKRVTKKLVKSTPPGGRFHGILKHPENPMVWSRSH